MKPGPYNTPLPRMRRQPIKLSVMLHQRRVAHSRRTERSVVLEKERRLLVEEQQFERTLAEAHNAKFEESFVRREDLASWCTFFLAGCAFHDDSHAPSEPAREGEQATFGSVQAG
jgi:hypothetical protein